MKRINCLLPYGCIASFLLAASNAQSQIVPASGETVVFQETFADNSNGWSNMGTTNSSASIAGGVLTAYNPGTGDAVNSSMTFGTGLNLDNGDISIYFTASIQDRYSQNRFGVNLTDSAGAQAGFTIHPGSLGNGYFTYTNVSGDNANQWRDDIAPTYVTSNGMLDYKLTISANGQDEGGTDIYSATFLMKGYDDGTSNDYGIVYTMPADMYFESGVVDALNLYIRNTSTPIKFDELVVTQIPEPGAAALLLGVAGLSLAAVRRRRA